MSKSGTNSTPLSNVAVAQIIAPSAGMTARNLADYIERLEAQLSAANARADAAQLDAESWARKAAHADHAAEESERENSDYREMHRATVAERAENGSNPLSVQQRIRRAEKAARDKALVEAAEKCGEYANGLIYDNGSHWMRHGLPAAILALRDKPAPAVTVDDKSASVCEGCGKPATGMCWTDCGMSLCGAPICDTCRHVDESIGWSHGPRAIAGGGNE